jgi:hypothetical protein
MSNKKKGYCVHFKARQNNYHNYIKNEANKSKTAIYRRIDIQTMYKFTYLEPIAIY